MYYLADVLFLATGVVVLSISVTLNVRMGSDAYKLTSPFGGLALPSD